MAKFTTITLACLHAGEVTLGQCQIYPPLVGVAFNNQGDCFQGQILSSFLLLPRPRINVDVNNVI